MMYTTNNEAPPPCSEIQEKGDLQPMEKMPTEIVSANKCHFCQNRQGQKMPPIKRPLKAKRPSPPPEVVEEPPKVETPDSLLQSTTLPEGPSLETVFSSTGIPVLQHKFQKALMGGSYGTPPFCSHRNSVNLISEMSNFSDYLHANLFASNASSISPLRSSPASHSSITLFPFDLS